MLLGGTLLAGLASSCSNGSNEGTDQTGGVDSAQAQAVQEILEIYSPPTPNEVVSMIRDEKLRFDPAVLNPTSKAARYETSMDMALNLGVYGADLTYASVFDAAQVSAEYFEAISSLASRMELDAAINKELVERLEDKFARGEDISDDVAQVLSEINLFLQDNGRQSEFVAILTGAWIEGLHILSRMDGPDGVFKTKIPDQKLSSQVMAEFIGSQRFEKSELLVSYVSPLEELYSQIDMGSTETTLEEGQDGIATIGSEHQFEVSPAQIEALKTQIAKSRAAIVH